MRVLICAHEAPLPPLNGFRLQVEALARALSAHHEVRLVAYRMPDQASAGASAATPSDARGPDVRTIPRPPLSRGRDLLAVLKGRPLGVDRLAGVMAPVLQEELRSFRPQVLHVTSGRLAALGPVLRSRATVLAALDAMHLNVQARALAARGLRRRVLRGEVRRVRRFIASDFPGFGRVVVVTSEDAAALHGVSPDLAISVVPNGIDTQTFAPDPRVERQPDRLVFTGNMAYAPNVTAAEMLARRVLPLVRERHPRARLVVVGRSAAPAVRILADLPGIEVTGEVPAVQPWLISSRVFVCPMTTGTGIKNKLLEALACGIPCVATPLALQGLEVTHGREVLVAEDAAALAEQVGRVLDDDALADRLGRAGRAYAVARHGWDAAAEAFVRIYQEVSEAGTTPAPASP